MKVVAVIVALLVGGPNAGAELPDADALHSFQRGWRHEKFVSPALFES